MRDKINSLLLESWSSSVGGVDTTKATDLIYGYLQKKIDEVTDSCEMQLENLEDEIASLEYDLEEAHKDAESLEEDMELSDQLLQEAVEELKLYKDIMSNNPNKYLVLNQLIYRIEEQIIKNGK